MFLLVSFSGLPDAVLHKATAKSQEFEGMYGKHRKLPIQSAEDKMRGLIRHLIEIATNLNFHETADERIGVSSLSELQNRARMLLKQN